MPKNRKRVRGAKSIGIRTKHKIGGRSSGRGAKQMSLTELERAMRSCRKKDRNKLRRAWEANSGYNDKPCIMYVTGTLNLPS